MAKSNGVLKIEGTVEDLTFYKLNGKNFVRRKGGISKERIDTEANFVRTRENNSEFKHSAAAGMELRTALGSMVFKAKDSKLSSRMLKLFSVIKNLDTTSARGSRQVSIGLTTAAGKAALIGFDFNLHAPLNSVLHAPYDLDTATGKISFTDLLPAEQFHYPQGATHVSIQSAVLGIDFATGVSDVAYSNTENLALNLTMSSPTLTPTSFPAGTLHLFMMMVSFYQEVNGVQYSLKNEENNVLNIIDVV